MTSADLSRVIQGIATGIGFIGGGAILKLKEEHVVQGLTTAASIWVATAIGVAAGLGRLWSAALGAGLAFVVLSLLGRFEYRLFKKPGSSVIDPKDPPPSTGGAHENDIFARRS
jgi:putative Mg2+ transporter-C (MgtC) family protein